MPQPGPPVVRGWCPGVFDPLLTGDGWLVRIRLDDASETDSLLDGAAYRQHVAEQ